MDVCNGFSAHSGSHKFPHTLIIVLVLVLLFFVGCSNGDDPNSGLYHAVSCSYGSIRVDSENEWIRLKSGGKLEMLLMGVECSGRWELDGTDFTVVQAGKTYCGTLENGMITLDLGGVTYTYKKEGVRQQTNITEENPPTEAFPHDDISCWEGDYYGWWVIDDVIKGNYDLEGNWWDCCMTLKIYPDGSGHMIIWDEDYHKNDPLATVDISISSRGGVARIVSESGRFMDIDVEHEDWLFFSNSTGYDDTLSFCALYEDHSSKINCFFFLRKWGTTWEDVEADDPNNLPYHYREWYLPLIEDGVTIAPDTIG